MPSLGVVTIGQSPRADLTGELAAYLPAGTRVLERGALDDLTSSAIAALAPHADEDTLTSRLRGGESVVLDRRRLVPLLEGAVFALEREGAKLNLLVCTGTFPPIRHRQPLLDAERLLVSGVSAVVHGSGPLGVVVPLAGRHGGAWYDASPSDGAGEIHRHRGERRDRGPARCRPRATRDPPRGDGLSS